MMPVLALPQGGDPCVFVIHSLPPDTATTTITTSLLLLLPLPTFPLTAIGMVASMVGSHYQGKLLPVGLSSICHTQEAC